MKKAVHLESSNYRTTRLQSRMSYKAYRRRSDCIQKYAFSGSRFHFLEQAESRLASISRPHHSV